MPASCFSVPGKSFSISFRTGQVCVPIAIPSGSALNARMDAAAVKAAALRARNCLREELSMSSPVSLRGGQGIADRGHLLTTGAAALGSGHQVGDAADDVALVRLETVAKLGTAHAFPALRRGQR